MAASGHSHSQANNTTRSAWDHNAAFWDAHMGEGNDFVEVLVWPASERLLALQPGEHVLDIACGNGLTTRRMAAIGAEVVAIDFSEQMLKHAQRRTNTELSRIQYSVIDATDYDALLSLGQNTFQNCSGQALKPACSWTHSKSRHFPLSIQPVLLLSLGEETSAKFLPF